MKRELPKDRLPRLQIPRPSDPHHHQHHLQLQQQQRPQPQQQHAHPRAPLGPPPNPTHRQPIIIHTYSPEVIQIDSDHFRQLVQRLTGPAGHGTPPHAPPPPKRPRASVPPATDNSNPNFSGTQGRGSLNPPHIVPHPGPSPRLLRAQQEATNPYLEASSNLPPNPLLSPSMFDFSPSVLPSPSTFSFDFPSMASPMGLRGGAGLISPSAPGGAASNLASPRGLYTPRSLAAALPSPGPLSTSSFLADLPVLSPAAYSWIEKNAATADAMLSSSRAAGDGLHTTRAMMSSGLPPRPPPTTTANLFPSSVEEEKPLLIPES